MARYIVNTSRFRPFEFDQLIQPVLAAEEAHANMDNQLTELRQKASVWDNLANQESDPETYRLYKQYADDLSREVDALNRQGLTPQTRSGLSQMQQRYSSDIIPIEQAYQRRQEHIKEQRDLEARDPSMRHSRVASTTSLDDYMSDTGLSYRSLSGNQLAAQVSSAAQALAKEMRDNPTEYRQILGGQQFEAITRYGFSSADVAAAIRGDMDANPILTNIVNDVMHSAGVGEFDPYTQGELRSIASQGLFSAVGEEKINTMANKKWEIDYNAAVQRDLLRHRAEMEAAQEESQRRPAWKPIPVASVDKGFLKDYGGRNFQKTSDIVREIGRTNRYGITDEDILKRYNDPKRADDIQRITESQTERVRDNVTIVQSASVAPIHPGIRPDQVGYEADTRDERTIAIDAIIDSMEDLGVGTLEDLATAIDMVETMAGQIDNSYALDLAKTDLALEGLGRHLSVSYTSGGEPLRVINKRGAVGKAVNREDAEKMMKSASIKTIYYDTSLDQMILSHEGERYAIQPELLHPRYKPMMDQLKQWNPKGVSRLDENGEVRPLSEYYDEVSFYSRNYDYLLKNMRGSFLDTFQEVFNSYPTQQSASGTDKLGN